MNKLYRCRLIDNGIVKELFFREGSSRQAVLDDLNFFKWGSGEWEIIESSLLSDENN